MSDDSKMEWEEFSIEEMRVVQLHIEHEDWDSIAAALVTMWQRVFSEVEGRTLLGIDVKALPDLGFDFYVNSEPPLKNVRLEAAVERMAEDCCEDNSDELLEVAWQALERGLAASQVLVDNASQLADGFTIRGADDSGREFTRTVIARS